MTPLVMSPSIPTGTFLLTVLFLAFAPPPPVPNQGYSCHFSSASNLASDLC
ncbi:hypothetical protein PGTUg99_012422 [Puccinia graminis f. sp. tritici]|nr:hypothetical protein PGTUg99_012422 [Puccinia graminis f. sp. tritici]